MTLKTVSSVFINRPRLVDAVFVCLVAFPVIGNAALVYENQWHDSTTDAGGFSQFDQMLASQFLLDSASTVNHATWNGTMLSVDPLSAGGSWNFDVVFRENLGGQPSSTVSTASVVASVTDTGQTIRGNTVYAFDASFSDVALIDNTSYFVSVINTGTQNTFRWNIGVDTSLAGYSSFDGGNSWSEAAGQRGYLNISLSNLSAVPVPAAAWLFGSGLLGLVGVARRKN